MKVKVTHGTFFSLGFQYLKTVFQQLLTANGEVDEWTNRSVTSNYWAEFEVNAGISRRKEISGI